MVTIEKMFCDPCNQFDLLDLGKTCVCKVCGLERLQSLDPSIGSRNSCDSTLFITHYSRVNRFIRLLENVVLPHGTTKDSKMLQFLDGHKQEVNSPETLITCMQKSGLADKRYSSLHLFHKRYVPTYISHILPRTYLNDKKRFERNFLQIEFAHRKSNHVQFFNYMFLLRHMLEREEPYRPYLKYVKTIKCAKRRQRYIDMLETLNIGCMRPVFQACDQNCDASSSEHVGGL